MKTIADTHTHTVMSTHAHSTLLENLREAKNKGLRFICVTDHTGTMPGSPHDTYFGSMWCTVPDEFEGVYVIRGCETNIIDTNGTVDISDAHLDGLEWRIASIHAMCFSPISFEAHTRLWLNVAKNPHIDVIGHCGDAKFDFDHEICIKAFAKYGKIVEINSSSAVTRPSGWKNCADIARLCAKYNVPLVISSDAHFAGDVGNHKAAIQMLEENGIDEKHILNTDFDRFAEYLHQKTGRTFVL